MKHLKLIAKSETKVAKDGREYYTAEFSDPANPFLPSRTRTFSQSLDTDKNPVWKGANPAVVQGFIGKNIPAYIKTFDVSEYAIEGSDRMATTYTCVILEGESEARVLRQMGKSLASSNVAIEAEEPANDGAAL